MADNYFVTAVLVSHDGAEWLPEVIASLFGQSRQIDRIIAVDNGSIDGSEKLLTGATVPTGFYKEINGNGINECYYFKNEKPQSSDFNLYKCEK